MLKIIFPKDLGKKKIVEKVQTLCFVMFFTSDNHLTTIHSTTHLNTLRTPTGALEQSCRLENEFSAENT